MSKKQFLDDLHLLSPFFALALIPIILYILSLTRRIKNRGGLKGKDRLKISIAARIILVIASLLFLFLFNWKLGLSGLFLGMALLIHEEWKNHGK